MTMQKGPTHPAQQYEYLVEARSRVLERVRALPHARFTQRFPFGHGSIRATVVHIADTEWWYTSMLRGVPAPEERSPFRHFSRTGLPPLEAAWRDLAVWTARALKEETDWDRPVEDWWTTKRWKRGVKTTAGGVATQLLFHEIHHRAQVMAMLRPLGAPLQGLDYSLLKWEWFKSSLRTSKRFNFKHSPDGPNWLEE
ncbi:MAG TPA: DinB family protein [bacterium]|nr:DinB family protein [bacterium]